MLDYTANIFLVGYLPWALSSPAYYFIKLHQSQHIELDSWPAIIALFLGQEFCYYWHHRICHNVRWFWCNHAVHHSPNEVNLSVGFRFGLFRVISGMFLFYIPLIIAGFRFINIMEMLSFCALYQFFIHVTWVPKLGWLEYVLSTPSAHRVHHDNTGHYKQGNYGCVLIIFDRIFGTYQAEDETLPASYGLHDPLKSNNPIKVEFREWYNLGKDLYNAHSIKEIFGYLLGKPGWKPPAQLDKP